MGHSPIIVPTIPHAVSSSPLRLGGKINRFWFLELINESVRSRYRTITNKRQRHLAAVCHPLILVLCIFLQSVRIKNDYLIFGILFHFLILEILVAKITNVQKFEIRFDLLDFKIVKWLCQKWKIQEHKVFVGFSMSLSFKSRYGFNSSLWHCTLKCTTLYVPKYDCDCPRPVFTVWRPLFTDKEMTNHATLLCN